jgi:hypothetical protein
LPIFLPILRPAWCRFDFFAGVQGYTGPPNFPVTSTTNNLARAGSGGFGFYEGFNEGRSLRRLCGCDLAAQLGLRATQSNLSGANFTTDNRQQVFVTGGFFRRVDFGLQYGLVADYLRDDWYFRTDLLQLRGELSWNTGRSHEFGFQFMAGTDSDTSSTVVRDALGAVVQSQLSLEATDQYRAFYRRNIRGAGYWSAFVGGTNQQDTVMGASVSVPLQARVLLAAGATYLDPNESLADGGFEQEGWNVSVGIVFRPGGPMGCGRYCRPMFDVADNGSFLVDRR